MPTLTSLPIAYCEELAAYILGPPGRVWAERGEDEDLTPEMEALALVIQHAIEHWLTEHLRASASAADLLPELAIIRQVVTKP